MAPLIHPNMTDEEKRILTFIKRSGGSAFVAIRMACNTPPNALRVILAQMVRANLIELTKAEDGRFIYKAL